MQYLVKLALSICLCLFISACSDDNSSVDDKKDHVWKGQTDAINQAKEAEKMMMDSAENTRKAIEEQK